MSRIIFSITLGIGIRGEFFNELEEYCFLNDCKISVKKLNGILCSKYLVEITGKNENIKIVNNWLESLN